MRDKIECQWCMEHKLPTKVVCNATLDTSHINVCTKCLPEVLAEIPEAFVLPKADQN